MEEKAEGGRGVPSAFKRSPGGTMEATMADSYLERCPAWGRAPPVSYSRSLDNTSQPTASEASMYQNRRGGAWEAV